MTPPRWRIRLGAEAEKDFVGILRHTNENFGERQADAYKKTLIEALTELSDGPDVAGSKARDEILTGSRTLHVARHGRRERHFIMYRAATDHVIEIVRILHDAMASRAIFRPTADESGGACPHLLNTSTLLAGTTIDADAGIPCIPSPSAATKPPFPATQGFGMLS